jgi:hypothetical protein
LPDLDRRSASERSLPEHDDHASNENYDWEHASGGMAAFAKLFETYGAAVRGCGASCPHGHERHLSNS